MTRICTSSSDMALNAQTTSFSIPGTCVGIVNESTMICDGYVVTEPLLWHLLLIDWISVQDLYFTVCTFSSTAVIVGPPTDMGPRGGH